MTEGTPPPEAPAKVATIIPLKDSPQDPRPSNATPPKPPRIKHKRLWLLWVCIFQILISTCDLWLNSSFVYEATKLTVSPTMIGISFGIYYALLGILDVTSSFSMGFLAERFKGTRWEGQQRAVLQATCYLICLASVGNLLWVRHPYAFPILHGCTGFGPQLAVMQTYTQDACDNDWDFRKQATKAILFGRVFGSLVALGAGSFIYDRFGWFILSLCCVGLNSLVMIFIITAPTRKVLWKLPKTTSIGEFISSLPSLLWCICFVTFSTGYFFGTINATQTLFIKDTFQLSPTWVGLVLAGAAVFSVLAMAFYPTSLKATWMSVGSNALLVCVLVVFGFSPWVILTGILLGLAYTCCAYLAAASQIMVDSITHPDVSVRVSGWNIAAYSMGTASSSFAAGIIYEQYVWLPFVIAAGVVFIILLFFTYFTVRYYEHLKHELSSSSFVVLAAAKWKHKAMIHRMERLKAAQEAAAKEAGAGGAAGQVGAVPSIIITPSEDVNGPEAGYSESRDDLSSSSSLSSNPSGLAGDSSAAIPPPPSSSPETFPPIPEGGQPLPGRDRISSRAGFQVNDHADLEHIHPSPPSQIEAQDDYDENSAYHQKGLKSRKPHHHSDVVQSIHMNDNLGLGLFVRLKSLKQNEYYNQMVNKSNQGKK